MSSPVLHPAARKELDEILSRIAAESRPEVAGHQTLLSLHSGLEFEAEWIVDASGVALAGGGPAQPWLRDGTYPAASASWRLPKNRRLDAFSRVQAEQPTQ